MHNFYFEITDTFGNEANYCWVKRIKINAKSLHGALCKLSAYMGLNFKCVETDYRYNAKKACICAFLLNDEYSISHYRLHYLKLLSIINAI